MNLKTLGLLAVGLVAGPTQVAHAVEASGSASLTNLNVNIYTTGDPNSDGNVSFVVDSPNLRGGTYVMVNGTDNNKESYTTFPTAPTATDSLVKGADSANANVNGVGANNKFSLDSGCTLNSKSGSCQGQAFTSSSSNGTGAAGFWDLILGPNTSVTMDADSLIQVALQDYCLVTCGDVFARSRLFMEFDLEDPAHPGLPLCAPAPDFCGSKRIVSQDTLSFDASFPLPPHAGTLFTKSSTKSLTLTYTNPYANKSVIGRFGFLTNVIADSAQVPEPGTLALLGLGLAVLGASRRRQAN